MVQRFPQHEIVGVEHGYCDLHSPELLERIRSVQADVLLVGLGNPTQELWLARHFEATGCALGIAVGALFDFVAGEISRAPAWMRAARLEWLYRLCLEPRRLSSRYLIRTPRFLASIFGRWWSGARGDPGGALAETNMPSRS
jgi:alpha-1,3-mannosyltransferase